VELQDFGLQFYSDDDTYHPGLLRAAGFTNMAARLFELPLGTWVLMTN
jgi:hypothetical protein